MLENAAIPRSTDGMVDIQSLLRLLAEQVVNTIMDEEADQLCGDGANNRNGYRDRSLETYVGTLNLRIPKLRTGSFFPEDVLERYQRVDRAFTAAAAEVYATGSWQLRCHVGYIVSSVFRARDVATAVAMYHAA